MRTSKQRRKERQTRNHLESTELQLRLAWGREEKLKKLLREMVLRDMESGEEHCISNEDVKASIIGAMTEAGFSEKEASDLYDELDLFRSPTRP
jgi:hypothetical protein